MSVMRRALGRSYLAALVGAVGVLAMYFVAISAALAYTAGEFLGSDPNRAFGLLVIALIVGTWVPIALGLRTRMLRRSPMMGVLQSLVVWLLLADIVMLAVAVVSTGVI